MDPSGFIFVACRSESQGICKNELLGQFPELRFSFSRPGFLTFKVEADNWPFGFDLRSTFARTYGWSLQQIATESLPPLFDLIKTTIKANQEIENIHVWCRCRRSKSNDLAHIDELALDDETMASFRHAFSESNFDKIQFNRSSNAGDTVLDVIKVDPGIWWLGVHQAGAIFQRWPGGIPILRKQNQAVSRAYYKLQEALLWSAIPIRSEDLCAEIGSAPGGSCQFLLSLGAKVIAIDPAELNPLVESHKNLTHLKMRGRDVPHRRFANVKWLMVDSNVAPQHSLDTVKALVEGKKTNFSGMLITLKLLNTDLAIRVPDYIKLVKSWGFQYVKARQLAFGKQEVCLMALRRKSMRRFRK